MQGRTQAETMQKAEPGSTFAAARLQGAAAANQMHARAHSWQIIF